MQNSPNMQSVNTSHASEGRVVDFLATDCPDARIKNDTCSRSHFLHRGSPPQLSQEFSDEAHGGDDDDNAMTSSQVISASISYSGLYVASTFQLQAAGWATISAMCTW